MRIITTKGANINTLKKEALKVAMDIGYPEETIKKIIHSTSESEIQQHLIAARHEWDVNPGRYHNISITKIMKMEKETDNTEVECTEVEL